MTSPTITVLMPVYNGASYLNEAIQSILAQTYNNLELLIIDDGSEDDSPDILESIRDPRIRVIRQENQGLPIALNRGIKLARGNYVVRMDCDDISFPNRLMRQLQFMNNNPDIGISGTWVKTFGVKTGIWKYPTKPEDIRCGLLFRSTIAHPSVIMRKDFLIRYNLLYDETYLNAQDFDLWERASQYFKLANLPKVLLRYRLTDTSHSRANHERTYRFHRAVTKRAIKRIGISFDNSNLLLHRDIAFYRYEASSSFLSKAEKWFGYILCANRKSKILDNQALHNRIGLEWLSILTTLSTEIPIFSSYLGSHLTRYIPPHSRCRLAYKILKSMGHAF